MLMCVLLRHNRLGNFAFWFMVSCWCFHTFCDKLFIWSIECTAQRNRREHHQSTKKPSNFTTIPILLRSNFFVLASAIVFSICFSDLFARIFLQVYTCQPSTNWVAKRVVFCVSCPENLIKMLHNTKCQDKCEKWHKWTCHTDALIHTQRHSEMRAWRYIVRQHQRSPLEEP